MGWDEGRGRGRGLGCGDCETEFGWRWGGGVEEGSSGAEEAGFVCAFMWGLVFSVMQEWKRSMSCLLPDFAVSLLLVVVR